MEKSVILERLFAIAPELSNTDNTRLNIIYELASDYVSESVFGKKHAIAVTYYMAHVLTLGNIVETSGATSSVLTGGTVQSEKEGDLQVTYSTSESTLSSDDLLNRTYYGKLFLELRKMYVFSAITRLG